MIDVQALSQLLHAAGKLLKYVNKNEVEKAKAVVAAEVIAQWAYGVLREYVRERRIGHPASSLTTELERTVWYASRDGELIRETRTAELLEHAIVDSMACVLSVDGRHTAKKAMRYLHSLKFLADSAGALNDAAIAGPVDDFAARGRDAVVRLVQDALE